MADEEKIIRDLKKAEARFQRARVDFQAASGERARAFRAASDAGLSLRRIASEVGITFARVRAVMRPDGE
jgi:hypothetical protein